MIRICRLYRQARDGNPEAQLANRGLWTSYREDGMLRLVALLPPEEGALVASVLESIALERWQQPAPAAGATLAEGREAPQVPDSAQDPWAARG